MVLAHTICRVLRLGPGILVSLLFFVTIMRRIKLKDEMNRWGSKLINDGDITFYQFIVSFMGVYFSGQATALAFSFSSSKSITLT